MKKILYFLCVLFAALSCMEHDELNGPDGPMQARQIKLSSTYPSASKQTRTTIGSGFVEGDQIGVFVVDYEKTQPGTPALVGNRASNTLFQLQEDGTWKATYDLYWANKETPADFYAYYPFVNELNSVTNYPFSVAEHQETEGASTSSAGYAVSDLLVAKSEKVMPTAETVMLQFRHIMAGVCIRLEMGEGFTATEWTDLEKTILVKNTRLDGRVNLQTGEVAVNEESEPANILPMPYMGTYRALVFPQTVEAGKTLVSITIDGQSYSLKKSETMSFLSGRMHNFTITVDRNTATGQFTFSLADEAITPWVDDSALHEGVIRQYIIVNMSQPGKLAEELASKGIDYRKVDNLKVVGNINQEDLSLMGRQMSGLLYLNLQKARIVGDENGNGAGYMDFHKSPWDDWTSKLVQIIFPEEGMTAIGGFYKTHLRGPLVIPEGVVEIGFMAFRDCGFNNTLTLPSTLKRIDESAFAFNNFTGPLNLPEGIEYIDPNYYYVFQGSDFSGTLHLPTSLKVSCPLGFPKMTGDIVIPQGITYCPNFSGGGYDGRVVIPEGLETIGNMCFQCTQIRGEVRIPSTVSTIKMYAFDNTKMSRLILPDGLKEVEHHAFSNNSRLQGTITIPKKLIRVPESCFENCPMLTGIVFHKDVAVIDKNAFAGCNNLNSIVCEGEEPPFVVDDAFLGVPKDNFTVEVPKGCVEKYRQARGWSDFKRIAEYQNFVCRPAQVGALNSVHQEDLMLNADGAWTVAKKPDWVTLSKTSGTGKTALTLTIQQMSKGQGNRVDTVKFEMNGYTTSCVVRQYDYQYDEDSYLTLQKATKGNRGGIDIVFVGDGWDGESISDGSYLDLIEYQTECFFAIEPYRSMRDYFNVYATFPLSQEKGVNTMYTYVNNRFGTLQGFSSLVTGVQADMTSTQLIMETDEVQQYVLDKTPVVQDNLWRTLVIAVPNSTEYEGNTVFNNGGLTISICPPSEQAYPRDTRGTIQHEAGGHGFAKLGDESISRNAFATNKEKQYIEGMHGRGWYENLATTGKLHDVPWAEFIFDPDYSDRVDVYEGGYGYTRGIYRPEANSCMNYGIPYYNTPSRLSIYKRIKDYAGESWLMSEFREQDTFAWGPTTITRSASQQIENLNPITNGNHHMPSITRFREMGDKVRAIRSRLKNERNKK